jgi:Flp pilus assembly protein CpaB
MRPFPTLTAPRSPQLAGRLSLVIGSALAVVTGLLIYGGLQYGREQIVAESQQPVVVAPVVVATVDIAPGTLLTSASLASQFSVSRVPANDLPGDTVSSLATLDGRTTATQLRVGDRVRTSDLVAPSATTAAGARADLLPPGYVAIVLPVTDQISVGGAVMPTDRVDLIANVPVSESTVSGTLVTQALLRDVRVVATGFRTRPTASPTPATTTEVQAPSQYSTLTLALAPQDALMVEHLLANNVRLALALRRPSDPVEPTTPVTTAGLVDRFGLRP